MKSVFVSTITLVLGLVAGPASAADTPAAAPAATTDPTPKEARRMQMPEPANPSLPSVFFIGDSTVRNGRDDGQGKGPDGQWGWGKVIEQYFDPTKVNVVNRAVGGLSSRTFLTLGHWERAMALMKPGDVVLMQFGHNDDGALNNEIPGAPLRARGTIKGVGEETQEIDNVMTKKHEVVHTYGWYLRKFIRDAKEKGVTPIVCSPIPRKGWTADGKVKRQTSSYAGWAKQVAAEEKVGFIDLNERVASRYEQLGREAVDKFFPATDSTHTTWAGAELNAQSVIAGLKALSPDPLAKCYSEKGQAIESAK